LEKVLIKLDTSRGFKFLLFLIVAVNIGSVIWLMPKERAGWTIEKAKTGDFSLAGFSYL
jgi:hypothetical protein